MSSVFGPESRSLFPINRISDLELLFQLEFLQKPDPNLALLSIIMGAIEHSLVNFDYTSPKPGAAGGVGNDVINTGTAAVVPVTPNKKRGSKGKSRRKSGRNQHSKTVVEFQQVNDGDLDEGNADVGRLEKPDTTIIDKINTPDDKDKGGMTSKLRRPRGDFPALELEEIEALYGKFKDMLTAHVDLEEYKGTDEDVRETSKELVKRVSDVVWSYLSRSYKADTPHIQSLYTYILGKKLDSFGVALGVASGCQILGLKDVHLALSEDHAWVIFGSDGQQSAEVTWHGKGIEDKRGQPVGLGDDVNSWLYLKGQAIHCTRHMEVAAIIASINFNINGSMNSSELIQIQQKLLWQLYDAGNLDRYPMALCCLAELEEIRPTPEKKSCVAIFQQAFFSSRKYYNNMHIYPYTNYAAYLYREKDYKSALKYWAEAAGVIQKYSRSKNDEEIYREFLEICTDYLTNIMKQHSTGFSAYSIMRDPCSFAEVLRFFDGICMWEENSRSSIVHIIWAKVWVNIIGKFDYTIRRMVKITLGNPDEEGKENSRLRVQQGGSPYNEQEKGKSFEKFTRTSTQNPEMLIDPKFKISDHSKDIEKNASVHKRFETSTDSPAICDSKDSLSTSLGELSSVIPHDNNSRESGTMAKSSDTLTLTSNLKTSSVEYSSCQFSLVAVDADFHSPSPSCSTFSTVSPSAASCRSSSPIVKGISFSPTDSGIDEDEIRLPAVTLNSKKIQQLKDLLQRERYNPAAMTLLLTAQSASSNITINSSSIKQTVDSGSGRPRRERLSQNQDSPKDQNNQAIRDERSPPRKRSKLEAGTINQAA